MKKNLWLALAIISLFYACQKPQNEPNTLTEEEIKEGWQLLFDGKTTDGWHLYNKGETPSAWMVVDGTLFCNPDTFEVDHGDLVTNKTYENFDLTFEWNITKAGNSGVFFNVQEAPEYPTAWTTGPEYQLLDNSGVPAEYLENRTHWAACLYGFKEIDSTLVPKPSGEWNLSRIKQIDGKIEYYLNGALTAQEDLKGENWANLVANSNFKTFPAFGKATSGHIALQDWSKGVSFRNIKIKTL